MPLFASLDPIPLWGIFVLSLTLILGVTELGYRAGLWRNARPTREKEGPVGGVVAAELGLLAFFLAFTFGIAAARFDERRRLVISEANAIGTTYLRAAMLPEPQRNEVRQLLREYTEVRIGANKDLETVRIAIKKSEELQAKIWDAATIAAAKDPHSPIVALFVQTTNEMIDRHTDRVQAGIYTRLPDTLWLVLAMITSFSFAAMGFHAGLSGTTRSWVVLLVGLTFATVIWFLVDLERPHEGVLRISNKVLVDLRATMNEPSLD